MAAEHATKIYSVAITGIAGIVAFLALTSTGHVIDAATQHFMLYYAGVLALIALCASVVFGLVATDRIFMNPGHRVFVQAAHRAASFGAVTFLIVHIVTEILAQRVHVLDAVIPFLSPFRTFYIGLGTIASDLIILLVITGIMRSRFNVHGHAWRWRAVHYTSYASFVFGVWHGLLGGRPGKPYVDWSYGFLVAFVAVLLAVKFFSRSLRHRESLSGPPVAMAANSASAPMRAAAMFAQLGAVRSGRQNRLVLSATAVPVLSAPTSELRMAASLLAAPVPAGQPQGAPFYEPGYEGPPRYLGAPRDAGTGPGPRLATGPLPRARSGPMPRAATGPIPRTATGPMTQTGPWRQDNAGSRSGRETGARPNSPAGSQQRRPSGPFPRAETGPFPRAESGPRPNSPTGSQPRMPAGPMPRAGTGPMPRGATGPQPRPGTGPIPRPQTGPMPRAGSGPMPQAGGGRPPYEFYGQGDPGQPPGRGSRPYGEANSAQPPWNGGMPESDPNFRYREPGPGMPGYRGSRDHRYGGDVSS